MSDMQRVSLYSKVDLIKALKKGFEGKGWVQQRFYDQSAYGEYTAVCSFGAIALGLGRSISSFREEMNCFDHRLVSAICAINNDSASKEHAIERVSALIVSY